MSYLPAEFQNHGKLPEMVENWISSTFHILSALLCFDCSSSTLVKWLCPLSTK